MCTRGQRLNSTVARRAWNVLGEIKERATIPVLGNGDIWEAFDALRMMRETGCDGVVIGRGCLGRPWLFRELAEVFDGQEPTDPPRLGEVLGILQEHAERLVDFFGERKGVLELRKWCSWYTKGFPGAAVVRGGLQSIESLEQMRGYLAQLDPDLPFPQRALRVARAKRGGKSGQSGAARWLVGSGCTGSRRATRREDNDGGRRSSG